MSNRLFLCNLPLSHCPSIEACIQQLSQALTDSRSLTVSFVNPHAWHIANTQPSYAHLLHQLDLVLADGVGVVKAMNWLHKTQIARLSFDATSLYRPVMTLIQEQQASLFIIGAAPGDHGEPDIAAKAALRMKQEFPDLTIAGTLHGHGDRDEAIKTILDVQPAIVLCGMGIPHQETFILGLKNAGFQGLSITCGGFLDQLVAAQNYYPPLIDRLDLRWLYRLYKEPGRLGRRYLVEYRPFIRQVLSQLIRQRAAILLPGFSNTG